MKNQSTPPPLGWNLVWVFDIRIKQQIEFLSTHLTLGHKNVYDLNIRFYNVYIHLGSSLEQTL